MTKHVKKDRSAKRKAASKHNAQPKSPVQEVRSATRGGASHVKQMTLVQLARSAKMANASMDAAVTHHATKTKDATPQPKNAWAVLRLQIAKMARSVRIKAANSVRPIPIVKQSIYAKKARVSKAIAAKLPIATKARSAKTIPVALVATINPVAQAGSAKPKSAVQDAAQMQIANKTRSAIPRPTYAEVV
jgi:hypothetical protein